MSFSINPYQSNVFNVDSNSKDLKLDDLYQVFQQLNAFIYFCGGNERGFFDLSSCGERFSTTFSYTQSKKVKMASSFNPELALENLVKLISLILTQDNSKMTKFLSDIVSALPLVGFIPSQSPILQTSKHLNHSKMRELVNQLVDFPNEHIRSLAEQLMLSLDFLISDVNLNIPTSYTDNFSEGTDLLKELVWLLGDHFEVTSLYELIQLIESLEVSDLDQLISSPDLESGEQIFNWIWVLSASQHSCSIKIINQLLNVHRDILTSNNPLSSKFYHNLEKIITLHPIHAYPVLIACRMNGILKSSMDRLMISHMESLLKIRDTNQQHIIFSAIQNIISIVENDDTILFEAVRNPQAFVMELSNRLMAWGYHSEALHLLISALNAHDSHLVSLKTQEGFQMALCLLSSPMSHTKDLIHQWDLFHTLSRKELSEAQESELKQHLNTFPILEGINWMVSGHEANQDIDHLNHLSKYLHPELEFKFQIQVFQKAINNHDFSACITILYRLFQLTGSQDQQESLDSLILQFTQSLQSRKWTKRDMQAVAVFFKLVNKQEFFSNNSSIYALSCLLLQQALILQCRDKSIYRMALEYFLNIQNISNPQSILLSKEALEEIADGKMKLEDNRRFAIVFDALIVLKNPFEAIKMIISVNLDEKDSKLKEGFKSLFNDELNQEQLTAIRFFIKQADLKIFSADLIQFIIERALLQSFQCECHSEIQAWKTMLEDAKYINTLTLSDEFCGDLLLLKSKDWQGGCAKDTAEFLRDHSKDLIEREGFKEFSTLLIKKLMTDPSNEPIEFLILSLLNEYDISDLEIWKDVLKSYDHPGFRPLCHKIFFEKFKKTVTSETIELWNFIFPTVMNHFELAYKIMFLNLMLKSFKLSTPSEEQKENYFNLFKKCLAEVQLINPKKNQESHKKVLRKTLSQTQQNILDEDQIKSLSLQLERRDEELKNKCDTIRSSLVRNPGQAKNHFMVLINSRSIDSSNYKEYLLPLISEILTNKKINLHLEILSIVDSLIYQKHPSCDLKAFEMLNLYQKRLIENSKRVDAREQIISFFETLISRCSEEESEEMMNLFKVYNDKFKFDTKRVSCILKVGNDISFQYLLKNVNHSFEINADYGVILERLNRILNKIDVLENKPVCLMIKSTILRAWGSQLSGMEKFKLLIKLITTLSSISKEEDTFLKSQVNVLLMILKTEVKRNMYSIDDYKTIITGFNSIFKILSRLEDFETTLPEWIDSLLNIPVPFDYMRGLPVLNQTLKMVNKFYHQQDRCKSNRLSTLKIYLEAVLTHKLPDVTSKQVADFKRYLEDNKQLIIDRVDGEETFNILGDLCRQTPPVKESNLLDACSLISHCAKQVSNNLRSQVNNDLRPIAKNREKQFAQSQLEFAKSQREFAKSQREVAKSQREVANQLRKIPLTDLFKNISIQLRSLDEELNEPLESEEFT